MRPEPLRLLLPALGLATGLPACVAGPAVTPVEWRVSVKLAAGVPETPTSDITERVARASGVAARYVSAAGGRWHSLGLQCADDTQCGDALRRLQADPTLESAERVGRQRRHGAGPGLAASSPT